MRSLAALLFLPMALASTPARADVVVTFYADPRSWVPSLKIFEKENTGHAWVSFDGTLADGTPVHESWGFAGHMPHGSEAGPVYRWTDKLQAGLYKIPGGLRAEPPPAKPGAAPEPAPTVYVSKTVTDAVYKGMQSTITAWRTDATSYNVLVQNCVRFADQIAGDAGLARPAAIGLRPTEYMQNLAKLNPSYTYRTDARAGTNNQPSQDEIFKRQKAEENGIILRQQGSTLDSSVRLLKARNDDKTREEKAAMALRQNARNQAVSASRSSVSTTLSKQHQFNNSVKADSEATIPLPTPSFSQGDSTQYYMTPTGSGGTNQYMANLPMPGSKDMHNALISSAQTSTDGEDVQQQGVKLLLDGATAPSLSPIIWLGLVQVRKERRFTLTLRADRDEHVQIFFVGEGSFQLGAVGTVANVLAPENARALKKGDQVDIGVALTPNVQTDPFERLIIASDGVIIYDAAILFLPVESDRVQVTTEYDNLLSGFGKYFSEPYSLCAGSAPYGYTFSSLAVNIQSLNRDHARGCDSYATCDITQSDDKNVCVSMTIQGHNEISFEPVKNIDFTVNATLIATYSLVDQKPTWASISN